MANGKLNGNWKWVISIALFVIFWSGTTIYWVAGTDSIVKTVIADIKEVKADQKDYVEKNKLEEMLKQRDIKIGHLKEGQNRIEFRQDKILNKLDKLIERIP